MTSYKEFIESMKNRGYIFKHSILIDESNQIINTLRIKKSTIGKVLELKCPNNTIISVCGKSHGCNNGYYCDIKFLNNEGKEPFQDFHYSTQITQNYHIIVELIVTKILQKPPDRNNPEIKKNANVVNSVLKLIKSENLYEYPMWSGIYKMFSENSLNNDNIFLNHSFNLYPDEKMLFYAINPNIDITKVKFNLKADILTKE